MALLLRDVLDGEFIDMDPYAVKTHRSLLIFPIGETPEK
jgi:hypothetical protein